MRAAMADVTEHFADGSQGPTTREWVEEVPVALEFNGLSYAVMMATPTDLEDFVAGFAHAEGLAEPGEIEAVELFDLDSDHDEDTNLVEDRASSDTLTQLIDAIGPTIKSA